MSLPPPALLLWKVSKLQNTNACEPKYLPRFLDVFCAPGFLPTSFTSTSKKGCDPCMWKLSFSNSEQKEQKEQKSCPMESFLPLGGTCEIREWHPYARLPVQNHKLDCEWASENFLKVWFRGSMCSPFRVGIKIWSSTHSCFCPSTLLLFSKSHTTLQSWTSTVHEFANKIGGRSGRTTRISRWWWWWWSSSSLTHTLIKPTHSIFMHVSSISP